MRIAQVAPLYEAVPPGASGGTERVIAGLCDGLVAMGQEVTLFAPETPETAAIDIWTYPFTRLSDVPTVLTMHGRLDLDFLRDLMPRYGWVPLVSISDDQRRAVADLDLTWAATVRPSRWPDGRDYAGARATLFPSDWPEPFGLVMICRRQAARFSAEAMCHGYAEVYQSLIDRRSGRRSPASPPPVREVIHSRAAPKAHVSPRGAR